MIGVIDSGIGNGAAVVNMFRRLRVPAQLLRDPSLAASAAALVLPGVGAFDTVVHRLDSSGWRSVLDACAALGRPFLGICAGMQVMAQASEEGTRPGLGWIATRITAFASDTACQGLPVPHMGWRRIHSVAGSPLFPPLPQDSEPYRFYFVHSFRALEPGNASVAAWCEYGRPFVAAWWLGRLWGVQFHPEKSHRFGMRVLAAFAAEAGFRPLLP